VLYVNVLKAVFYFAQLANFLNGHKFVTVRAIDKA